MIVTVPFLTPFTTPLEVTVAIFLLEVLYVTFSSLFFGVTEALMAKVFPFFTVLEDGTPLSFVVFTFSTLTVTVAFLLPDFTVILAVPAAFPVITPLLLTVATLALDEL